MQRRLLAPVTGLLGGLAWLLRWFVLGDGAAGDTAYWTGFVLLAVALVAHGAGLVTAVWLQVVVGIAFPVLVWSVLEVLHGAVGDRTVDGLAGAVAVLAAVVGLLRARRTQPVRDPAASTGGAPGRRRQQPGRTRPLS